MHSRLSYPPLLSLILLLALPTRADHPSDSKEGHSTMGEAFSEGPRQAAELLTGVADITHFPVTTDNPEAQKFFNQGICQLHGFWYLEAERSFRQAFKIDPKCVMAHWGIAMANVENEKRAAELMATAMKLPQDHLTPREKAFLKSLADYYGQITAQPDQIIRLKQLIRDLEQIVVDNPDDIEAKAFLVLQIWLNSSKGIPISSHLAIDTLANQILTVSPRHPGVHHYRIHLWNFEKDARALNSAALLGPTAPGVAHLWHMPSHTYSELKRYADAAYYQEAGARVDHAHMMRFRLMPDEIHNYSHNNGWLVESYTHVGKFHDALKIAKNLIGLPRVPHSNLGLNSNTQNWNAEKSSWKEGRQRILPLLLNSGKWDTVLQLENTPYLATADDPDWNRRSLHLCALAHLETEPIGEPPVAMKTLETQLAEFRAARDKAVNDAKTTETAAKKSEAEILCATKATSAQFEDKITQHENLIAELTLVQTLKKNDATLATDLLGKAKGIPDIRLSRYWLLAGAKEKALEFAQKAVDASKNQVIPLTQLVACLQAAGKTEETQKNFTELRTLASQADLDLPAFLTLATLTQTIPGDWRLPSPPPADIGERPDLNTLGPAEWTPTAAPQWSLTGLDGVHHSSTAMQGKPYLLVFFLGQKCSHCMEQLNAFAPENEGFQKAGIPIFAVSTDTVDRLNSTLDKEQKKFPFPLLCDDPNLSTFHAFRAYDDFENFALHTTVLVDGQGKIRWQHTGFKPFMNPKFLLEEAQRLLSLQPVSPVAEATIH